MKIWKIFILAFSNIPCLDFFKCRARIDLAMNTLSQVGHVNDSSTLSFRPSGGRPSGRGDECPSLPKAAAGEAKVEWPACGDCPLSLDEVASESIAGEFGDSHKDDLLTFLALNSFL